MKRTLLVVTVLVAAAAGIGLFVTRPVAISQDELAGIAPDLARGEAVFHAAGCASCHAASDATGDARLVLMGGKRFETPFGTFVAPNISPHPEAGIGTWSVAEIVTAIAHGTSPQGAHYYPAFPYTAYQNADLGDLVSLAAYLQTLPPDPTPSQPHDVGFPFNIRTSLGGWKFLFGRGGMAVDLGDDAKIARGQYLAEALGHCGECHTPRNPFGGLDRSRWFTGAPNPSGRGRIPNITPAELDWSLADIAAYLKTGFTPDFDVAGGSMTDVVTSLSNLPDEDIDAIAAYVKAVPPAE